MSDALLAHVEKKSNSLKKAVPPVRTGDRVKVHQKIQEGNKERVQIFEGLVISTNSGAGVNSTFTVRKIASGVGVEKMYLLHSPNIVQIEIIGHAKTRRSKLYFMRERTGKRARLKEGKMLDFEMPADEPEVEETPAEEASTTEATTEEATPETAEAPAAPEAEEAPKE